MSLFGNIFDNSTNFSSDLTTKVDRDIVSKVSDYIDKKVGQKIWQQNGTKNPEKFPEKRCASSTVTTPVEKIKTFDLSPKNQNIVDYCTSLINLAFNGQCEEEQALLPPTTVKSGIRLSEALSGIDEMLRSVDQDFSGEEEEFQFYLQACLEARQPSASANPRLSRKFRSDAKKFVQIYKERETVSEELTHIEYWATRQQLLSGKVVVDWLDLNYGPMDPIFGVLLNPTLGRTGPGDSGWVHKFLFDDSGPMAYHSAVHDAFGYLISHHNVGPGYDYLGAWSLFESHTCMSGQLSGIKFWRDVLKNTEDVPAKTV